MKTLSRSIMVYSQKFPPSFWGLIRNLALALGSASTSCYLLAKILRQLSLLPLVHGAFESRGHLCLENQAQDLEWSFTWIMRDSCWLVKAFKSNSPPRDRRRYLLASSSLWRRKLSMRLQ